MSRRSAVLLILAASLWGAFNRVTRLDLRPMHTDEAVQAVKSGTLLETGHYHYDPQEYHGPTLPYATDCAFKLFGVKSLKDATETELRLVPAAFGVASCLLFLFLVDGLGAAAAVTAAGLMALSPAMVFYSRYYIHETLLVFFTFAAIAAAWRHTRTEGWFSAILTGMALSLMFATKETCLITYLSFGIGLCLMEIWCRIREDHSVHFHRDLPDRHHWPGIVVGLLVSILLFSEFLTNAQGPINSLRSPWISLGRASQAGIHEHPWHYYLSLLAWNPYGNIVFSEGFILLLCLIGCGHALRLRGHQGHHLFLRFLVFYTLSLTVLYAFIPYKTPWCLLSFLHGMILLAGVGGVSLVRGMPHPLLKVLAVLLLAAGFLQLAWQSSRINSRFCADRRNPYVYAHTAPDLLKMVQRIEEITEGLPSGHDTFIQAIGPDIWPLPWYLRGFTQVGYWQDASQWEDAPLIISDADAWPSLEGRLQDKYQTCTYGLRPEVFIFLNVRQDIWDEYMKPRM